MKLTTGNNLPPNEYAYFVTTFSIDEISVGKRRFLWRNKLDLLVLTDSVASLDRNRSFPARGKYTRFNLKELRKLVLAKNHHLIIMSHQVTKKVLGMAIVRHDGNNAAYLEILVMNAELSTDKLLMFFERYVEDFASKCLDCKYFIVTVSNKDSGNMASYTTSGYIPHKTEMCKYIEEQE